MKLGWDGAEVTPSAGHLIEQFFDPNVNTRTDRYGGSLDNPGPVRPRGPAVVRRWTSDAFLVSFRMTADQALPSGGGMSISELADVAAAMLAQVEVNDHDYSSLPFP
jgi:2,4-dienoyl-CoA reductase-like NADH-dependent reductase (Old Yellow Enzyme family)